MKLKLFAVALFVFIAGSIANAQTTDLPSKHSLSLGPIAGYNFESEGLTYGAGLLYEFRPFQKFGFIAGLTYQRTRSDVDFHYGDIDGSTVYGDVRIHQVYAFHAGARYYMDRFYLSGSLGVAYDDASVKLSNGMTVDAGHAYGLYKSIGAGYQLPLKNNDALEFEAGYFGSKFMNIGGTVRYKFGK